MRTALGHQLPVQSSRRLLSTIRRAASSARHDRQHGFFTCTARYQPLRMICAIPRASLRSVLFGIAPIAAFAWRVSSVIAVMTQEIDRLTKRVLDEVRIEPTCRRLMTVQGVGPFTALAFRATIDRPDRFRRSRDVGAHLGLTPRRYQSGTDVQGRISRCGDELARTALYEAPIRC